MNRFFKFIVIGVISSLPINGFCFAADKSCKFSDLNKKSYHCFVVPFVLRFDPDKWAFKREDWVDKFSSLEHRNLEIFIKAYNEEKNLSDHQIEKNIQNFFENEYSDPTLFSNFSIKPSNIVQINGIRFLHQPALINLTPNSRHPRNMARSIGWRLVPSEGRTDQLDHYIFSGDKGSIYIGVSIESREISSEDKAAIDDLFKGFSLDGSACRGPKLLRGFKNVLEQFSNN